MTLAVALFGLFVATLGAAGMLSPRRLLDLVTRAQSRMGIYSIAGLRLLVGLALLAVAGGSRAPLYLLVLGGLSLVSGAVTPFVGLSRFERILDWWRRRGPGFVRAWSGCVLLFGLSLVWAVFPLRQSG